MAKYNAQKRQEIEQKAAQTPGNELDKNEAKLNIIINQDPKMAELYKDIYGEIKSDKEYDYNEAERVHNRYAYLDDKNALEGTKYSKKYNLRKDNERRWEEEIMTTELSDMELDLIYKRYKFMQMENDESLRNADEEAYEFMQKYNAGKARVNDRPVRTLEDL